MTTFLPAFLHLVLSSAVHSSLEKENPLSLTLETFADFMIRGSSIEIDLSLLP